MLTLRIVSAATLYSLGVVERAQRAGQRPVAEPAGQRQAADAQLVERGQPGGLAQHAPAR